MVDLIADKVLFNLENNLSGSAVITGNVVRIFGNIWAFYIYIYINRAFIIEVVD